MTSDAGEIITSRGWAWPVELSLDVGGPRDALIDAVLDLVACGCSTLDAIHLALRDVPHSLVRGAVDHAILHGFLSGEPDTRLVLTDPDERPPRLRLMQGYVVWSVLEGRLLPAVWVGNDRPPKPKEATADVIGDNDERVERDLVGERLVALAGRDDLVIEGPLLPPDIERPPKLDALVLPHYSKPRALSLCHWIEVRASAHGAINLVVRRGHHAADKARHAPVWSHGESALRRRADAVVTMEEIDRKWREVQYTERLAVLPDRFGSADELLERLDENVRLAVPPDELTSPWADAELFELAQRALFDAKISGAIVVPTSRDTAPAAAWGALLEELAKRLWAEGQPYIEARWDGAPSSKAEAREMLRELGLTLGASERHVLGALKNGSTAMVDELRRGKLPSAGGGRASSRAPALGVGDMILLWLVAALVNESGRKQHAARIRRAQLVRHDLLEMLTMLVECRNRATHRRDPQSLPADEVIADRSLSVWRALGATARE